MGKITLLTGGVRSGKSALALELAKRYPPTRGFIATAVAIDDEMQDRITKHKSSRDKSFVTLEEPYEIASVLLKLENRFSVVVLDCLTVWLGNKFHKLDCNEIEIKKCVDDFVAALQVCSTDIVIVTNETGWGIVPENEIARKFRDMAGYANQVVAKVADTVHLLCCGIPIKIKESKDQ
jgi:adenosylcobinamide kinase/adenosylcobinamide-phosphate guanylyltransferase